MGAHVQQELTEHLETVTVNIELVEVVKGRVSANLQLLSKEELSSENEVISWRDLGSRCAAYRSNTKPRSGFLGDPDALNDATKVAFPLVTDIERIKTSGQA